MPNRLPANLLEPEKWRRRNWDIASAALKTSGYDVIDYQTSVNAFERSGLPVEDTHSSRDKYADLATALAVDAIIIPYYGTFASSRPSFLIQSAEFSTVTTLQVYVAERNDFGARIDASGTASYSTGYGTLAGLALLLTGTLLQAQAASCVPVAPRFDNCNNSSSNSQAQALQLSGGVLSLVDLVSGIYYASKSVDSYWESAFDKSIREAIQLFTVSFPRG